MAVTAREIILPGDVTPRAREGRWVTDFLLLLMAIIWGINFSVLKYGTQFLAPLAFNGVRIPIAAGAQLAIARAMRLPQVPTRTAVRLVLLGMLGNGVYQVLFILGIVRTRVATAALIIAATPALIAMLGRIRGTEHLSRRNWVGIACQLLGASTVVLGSARGGQGEDSLLGGALILGAAMSWAVYSVLLQGRAVGVHTMQIGGYTALGGAIVMVLVAIPALRATTWTALPVGVWYALLYSSLLAMVVAYLFWYRGLRVLGPTRTAVYSNLQPLIAGVVAYFALHELPTGMQLVGAVLVISGLLLTRS